MFTDEFKRYILIGVSIMLIIGMIVFGKSNKTNPGEDAAFSILMPVQEFFDGIGDWFGDSFANFGKWGDALGENKKLRDQIEELKVQNTLNEKFKGENEELKLMLNLKDKNLNEGMIASKIVGVDPSATNKILIINKGTEDGVLKDMIAIHGDGLVGRVLEAGVNHSKVVTLTDNSVTMGVAIDRTHERLILNGNNIEKKNTCMIDNIDSASDLLKGDVVSTSNISMLYPEGIKVGTVDTITMSGNGITKKAKVDVAVDFDKINYVMLIKNKEMLEDGIGKVFSEFGNASRN